MLFAEHRESDTTRRTTQTMSTETQSLANDVAPSPAGQRELEALIGFREAVRRIAASPIDSSDMMDEIDHLLSLPQNVQ